MHNPFSRLQVGWLAASGTSGQGLKVGETQVGQEGSDQQVCELTGLLSTFSPQEMSKDFQGIP